MSNLAIVESVEMLQEDYSIENHNIEKILTDTLPSGNYVISFDADKEFVLQFFLSRDKGDHHITESLYSGSGSYKFMLQLKYSGKIKAVCWNGRSIGCTLNNIRITKL